MMKFRIVNQQTSETVAIVNNREGLQGYHEWPYRIFYIEEIEEEENEMSVNLKIKRLTETAKIPTRGSDFAAGYDLYADITETITISPHTTEKIPTGIATEIPHGYFAAVFPRSGIATKKGLNLANCTAIIDEDYRGQWYIPIHNIGLVSQTIEPGERIAQLILMPYQVLEFQEVDELSETERGEGGFGHSGTK